MDKLGKIRQHHWKERLNISTIVKFQSDTSLASEDIAPQSCEIYTRLYGSGQVCAMPHHVNVCKFSRL